MNKRPVSSLSEAKKRYGDIINGSWPNETKWMRVWQIPKHLNHNWINTATGKPVTKIYINKDAIKPLEDALNNLQKRNLLHELKTFDGCYNIRDIRGIPGQLSTHAYGLAIDLNAAENPLGAVPRLSPEFVKCWTDAGWTWGGNFKRKDGMHFEFAWN